MTVRHILPHAVPLHALQVIASEVVPSPRRQPVIVQGVVSTKLRPRRRRIFLPPLHTDNASLVACGEELDQDEFDDCVAQGYFTRIATVPVPVDGYVLVLWDVGDRLPMVVSLRSAATVFATFEEQQLRLGDEALSAGDEKMALSHYEIAAAACQTPAAYARMLIVNLAPRRRARILDALVAVSNKPEQGSKA